MEKKITTNLIDPKLSSVLEILLKQHTDIYIWPKSYDGGQLGANDRIVVELKSFSALTNEMVVKSKNSEIRFIYNEGDIIRFSNYRSNLTFETKILKVHPHLLFLKKPKMINLDEARKDKRINVSNRDISIRYTIKINNKDETILGQVLDISPTGIGLMCLERNIKLMEQVNFGEKIELTQFNLQNLPIGAYGSLRYKQIMNVENKKNKIQLMKVGIQMDPKVDIEDLILDFDWEEQD